VRALRPTLLVLDPFVRLHRIDENASAEVAPLLDFLRGLQRRYKVAIVLVHHARKGASHIRAGQALRGSSELHAWGDSNLYLRRNVDDELSLTIEHRAAASMDGLSIALHAEGDALALRVVDVAAPTAGATAPVSPLERVERILADATAPMTHREIRDLAKIRAATVSDALAALVTDGRIVRTDGRYELARR
jgi:hypothetical protein